MADSNTMAELKALIKLCKKEQVKSIEFNGIKLEFSNVSYAPKRRGKSDNKDPKVETQYSDEDILFWSSGGING